LQEPQSAASLHDRRRMPRVRGRDRALAQIDRRDEAGHIQRPAPVVVQIRRELRDDARGIRTFAGERAKRRSQRSQRHRRRDALTGHIGHEHDHLGRTTRHEIVEVAANRPR